MFASLDSVRRAVVALQVAPEDYLPTSDMYEGRGKRTDLAKRFTDAGEPG